MPSSRKLFLGIIVSPESLKNINILNGFVVVENGKITNMGTNNEYEELNALGKFSDFEVIKLRHGQFLMPGFVDCHTHAPQYPNIGLGLDRPLLQWLEKYTFPLEKEYNNTKFAAKIYGEVVKRLLKNGTTTACYFGTLHLNGTLELVSAVVKHGQRAFVGKVSMNMKNDAGYFNDTEQEIKDVQEFLDTVVKLKNDLVQPVVTPRFAVSCDKELMSGLARLAREYDCLTQSHISENKGEIDYVLHNNPTCNSYTEVYDESNILNDKCVMAHAIHLSPSEMEILAERGVSVAHCPASNTRLMSGLCPLRDILRHGIRTGLGTDVSGGDSASILDTMRRCMDVSAHRKLLGAGDDDDVITWLEALYLATLGGAEALSVSHKTGNFKIGKDFDALLVNVFEEGGPIDYYDYSKEATKEEAVKGLLQKFIYLGDDRNIVQVYVKGVEVKCNL